ncbi:MAG: SUF system NifU family Fe-S cluster assembly protein [Gammaproteobacteria bacterium]|nr:SUF system NifU family Fe-S cluster assembly protein [Gammaproteobacteria bacterium]
MSDLRELYQEVILDHGRKPRNFGPLPEANRHADGNNPLCGDQVHVHARVEDGVVREVHFEGVGCAISTASASLMTQAMTGKPEAEARALFDEFHELVAGNGESGGHLGKLVVFAGVREYPSRVKCATLAWHTLQAALEDDGREVTTE